VRGALMLAKECREMRVREETELRAIFDDWLQMLDLGCRCKTSEYREAGRWYACSRFSPAVGDSTTCPIMHTIY